MKIVNQLMTSMNDTSIGNPKKKWFWRELTEWTLLDFRRENYHKLDLMDILGSHDPMIILVNRSPLKMGVSPLVNIQKHMGTLHFQWENPLKMAMFNSYVSLSEGNDWRMGFTGDPPDSPQGFRHGAGCWPPKSVAGIGCASVAMPVAQCHNKHADFSHV